MFVPLCCILHWPGARSGTSEGAVRRNAEGAAHAAQRPQTAWARPSCRRRLRGAARAKRGEARSPAEAGPHPRGATRSAASGEFTVKMLRMAWAHLPLSRTQNGQAHEGAARRWCQRSRSRRTLRARRSSTRARAPPCFQFFRQRTAARTRAHAGPSSGSADGRANLIPILLASRSSSCSRTRGS